VLAAARILLVLLAVVALIAGLGQAVALLSYRDPISHHHTRQGWAIVAVLGGAAMAVLLAGSAEAITLLFNIRNHQTGRPESDARPLSATKKRLEALRQLRD
jgi:hypothetical protein